MKRSTLLLLLAAIVGGIVIYFLEIKPGTPRDDGTEKPAETASKDAVSFKREDIAAITVTRGGETVSLESEGDKWLIKQPVAAAADDTATNSLIGDIVSARIQREFVNPSADALKEYGLATPAVKLEIRLKDGKTHQIELGGKDPLGSSAYARFDGAANAVLIGSALLTSADKPLKDWRDRSLLGASEYDLTSLKVTNENGSFELGKKEAEWAITSPISADAEASEVSSLIGDLTSAKAAEIVSETAEDLPKYGLDKPKISVSVKTASGDKGLQIGSKVEEQYYAKTVGGTQIVKIESALYDKLNTKLATLRSKQFIKLKREDLTRYELKNEHGKLVATAKDDKWVVVEPADKKDKEAQPFKLFTPFESRASEILDKATAAINAKFAKPSAELRLTDKAGKTTVIKMSQPDGEDIYIRVEGRPEIYKLGKMMLESFNFKIEDAIQQ
ncbi:MAG: DUF4340 domain-containing protein [Acidobacteriota bacterium]